MLVGLQGTGKTTLAAKLGLHLRKQGKRVMLAACDVYRPAAVTQLESLGKQLSIPVYSEGIDSEPPDIARRALDQARQDAINVLIIDTAGRLQIDEELMEELEDINRTVQATERLLVVDAMTGQEAVRVAETFNKQVSLTGLVMTKMDGDARGGAALSVRSVTGLPIKFMSTGEKVDTHTLEAFHPDRLAQRILGMGDVMSLIERAEQLYDEEESKKMEKKLRKGKFDFADFLQAMEQMRKLGPLQQIMQMIPGMSQMTRGQEEMVSEKDMKRIEAIVLSMTPKERRNPDVLDRSRSRRERIARGSGTSVAEVNALLKQFKQMQQMMKQLSGGNGKGGGKRGRKGRGGGGKGMPDAQELMRMLRQ
jgi:signal recognition particle subunit SRP54